MIPSRRAAVVLTVCAMAVSLNACAQTSTKADYQPEVGQAGKDVVWVPTAQALVDRMLDMAQVTPQDVLVDLGSGDGRTVITAAKRGLKARGIEYNPDLVAMSQRAAKAEGVADRATFENADIFKSDFSNATVVTLFLLPDLNLRLRPTLLAMKPGTRVLSNSFTMGDWEPDQSERLTEGCTSYCQVHKWVVPAQAAGTWTMDGQAGESAQLVLAQTYQKLTGTLSAGNTNSAVNEARVSGQQISFGVGNDRYTGQIQGNQIQGTVNGARPWRATRKAS